LEALISGALLEWAKNMKPVEFGQSIVLLFIGVKILKPYINEVIAQSEKNSRAAAEAFEKSLKDLREDFHHHSEEVKKSFSQLVDSVGRVNDSLVNLQKEHEKKLDHLSESVKTLKDQVKVIEEKQNQTIN
jgi:phage-related tail protein